jgi:septum formation protein
LLARLRLHFEIVPSHLPEDGHPGETPGAHAERLSREKAARVGRDHPDALVLAGDTVVVLDGVLLGKPESRDEAVTMLCALAGRTHVVVSGLALAVPGGGLYSGTLATLVTFRPFDEAFARRYADTGEPLDKAGAYGIQGLGSALVQEIQGDYHTVVGLPIPLLLDLLLQGGWRYEFGELRPALEPRVGAPGHRGSAP